VRGKVMKRGMPWCYWRLRCRPWPRALRCAILGLLRGRSHDSGFAERDPDPHRSAHADVHWHDFHCVSQSEPVPGDGGLGRIRCDLEQSPSLEFSDDPMASTRAIADPHASNTVSYKLRDYYILTKPEVNLLILMTTSAGYYLGSPGPLWVGRLFLTLVGTLLVASGTATLNQLMERLYDRCGVPRSGRWSRADSVRRRPAGLGSR
jgi:hypothetical protein